MISDNASAQMGPVVTHSLDHPNRACWGTAFTPVGSFWLNLVERWLELIERRVRRGGFFNVSALADAIETSIERLSDEPKSFIRHGTAQDTKARRRREARGRATSATRR
jgi:hypothetical protein